MELTLSDLRGIKSLLWRAYEQVENAGGIFQGAGETVEAAHLKSLCHLIEDELFDVDRRLARVAKAEDVRCPAAAARFNFSRAPSR